MKNSGREPCVRPGDKTLNFTITEHERVVPATAQNDGNVMLVAHQDDAVREIDVFRTERDNALMRLDLAEQRIEQLKGEVLELEDKVERLEDEIDEMPNRPSHARSLRPSANAISTMSKC